MQKNNRFETLLTMSTGLLMVYAITRNKYLLLVIIIFNISVLFIKPFSNLIVKSWLRLSDILGMLSSGILLSLIFYFFLTPIAFIYRLFNKNNIKKGGKVKSMYLERNYRFTSNDLEFPG